MVFNMLNFNPQELEDAAIKCDVAISSLKEVSRQLTRKASSVFAEWTGTGATSLNQQITDALATATSAEGHLTRAAAAFRKAAGEIRTALAKAEKARKAAEAKEKAQKQKLPGG